VLEVVEDEAREVAARFGRDRRSMLSAEAADTFDATAVVHNEPSFVLFSKRGFIKRMRADTFHVQRRNGRGACSSDALMQFACSAPHDAHGTCGKL